MSKKTLVLLGTSFLLFLVAATIRIITFNQMRQYTRDVELSRNLIVSLEKLSNHLKSAQIYSADSTEGQVYNFYRLYQQEGKMIPAELDYIDSLIKNFKGSQQQHWQIVKNTIRQQLPALMRRNVASIEQSPESWRLGALLRINSTIHFMVSHEEAKLDAQKSRLHAALTWTDALSLALVVTGLLIFGLTFTHNLRLTRKGRWLEGFLASVLNTSQNGIISYRAVRERGRISRFAVAYSNEAVKPLLGLTNYSKEIQDQHLEAFIREANLYQQFCTVTETGVKTELEIFYAKEGISRWLQVLIARRDDGITLSLHDISTIKQYQEDLKNSITQLERSNAELEQYAYAASHDLQEPLRKITTFGHLLNDHEASGLDEKGRRYLEKILFSATRMSALIRDLLSFSSLKRKADFEPVNLGEVVESVLQDLELAVSQKEARIHTDTLPIIDAIPLQMHQLFFNLLNNALKFASPNRRPEIRITCSPLAPDERAKFGLLTDRPYLKLMVADNGIGFDKDHAHQIFGLFKRLNNKELYSGSGIGLALCKRVVENHHGHIFAEAQEGYGARFYILIPEKQPDSRTAEEQLRNTA